MAKTYEYRGDLAETTLPEMLFSINRFQVPGVVEARRDGVKKRVYLRDGHVIQASSTDIEDSLGAHLRRTGQLTEDQYRETMRARKETRQKYGSLLIDNGVLSPAEIFRGIRSQIEAIVWSLFYWQSGEVTFTIGDYSESGMVRIHLPMNQAILSGIKKAPNAKTLVGKLGSKETVFEPTHQVEDLVELALEDQEYQMLRLVDGKKTLYEVCTAGPYTAAENAKLMYAFLVLRLVRRADVASEKGRAREMGSGKIVIKMNTASES